MNLRKSELIALVEKAGYEIPEKVKVQDLINILAKHSLKENRRKLTWALSQRLKIKSPQLCYPYWKLKPEEQQEIWGDKYLFEPKYNGIRVLIFYHPQEGFSFYGRNVSEIDFLPEDYTEKLLLIREDINLITTPKTWKEKFSFSFILDGEIICNRCVEKDLIKGLEKTIYDNTFISLPFLVLSSNVEQAHILQLQSPLTIKVFDILAYNDKWVIEYSYVQRKKALKKLLNRISQQLPFEYVSTCNTDKEVFYELVTELGYEGVVAKRFNGKYYTDGKRQRDIQIKIKPTIYKEYGDDIDCFIIDAIPPTCGTTIHTEGLVAGLRMGVYLKKGSKISEEPHWIATCANLPPQIRYRISDNTTGNLLPQYKNRVMTINCSNYIKEVGRFRHAVIDWQKSCVGDYKEGQFDIGRIDKDPQNCILELF